MKLCIEKKKPRNPLVAPSLRRKAGPHRQGKHARRIAEAVALRRELDRLIKPSP